MSKNLGKLSDSELVALLNKSKKESEPAFAEIYTRYSQRIYAYCLRITGSTEDTNDIFQDTFYKFFNSVKKGSKVENLPGFLLTIARNLCLNHKRNKKINFELEDYHLFSNDSGYEKKELLDLIASSLDLLEFKQREAFVLRQYQGMKYKEIAEVTGENITTVKNRVWRAKEKIKEILQPYLQDMTKK